MKPLNFESLKKAYITFVAYFLLLSACSLLCLFFYFHTRMVDYRLIEQQFDEIQRYSAIRMEIDGEMADIEQKFERLSQSRSTAVEELDDQYNALASIRGSNKRIKTLVEGLDVKSNSYQLYKKLSDDLSSATDVQDSLFNTRFQIASIKEQLEACLRTHRLAEEKLSAGLFRRR